MQKISFPSLPRTSQAPGQHQQAVQFNGRRLRILELTPDFVEHDWCTRGHIGYVLSGTLELQLKDETVTCYSGEGFFLAAGAADGHKPRALTPIVRILLVEDDA